MRDVVQPIADRLHAFVDQRENLTLVLRSPSTDALPMLKLLEGLEDSNPSDLFWLYADDFRDAASYASGIARAFASKHQLVQLAMQQEGMKPWPALPPELLSEQLAPAARLRKLAMFSRELLPIPFGGNNVWIFYPLQIADHSAFAQLVREVVDHTLPNPWCHHLRFIVREDPQGPGLRRVLTGCPGVEYEEPDLGADVIRSGLERQAANESLPLEERLNAVLVLAGNDVAFGRLPAALEKYALLLQYHAPLGNTALAAVALNGMGEVYERMGDLERANQAYMSALIPATDGPHPPIPVFRNVAINLANLRMTQKSWDEAEGYWDVAQQLAIVSRDGPGKVYALDQLGYCQRQQGKLAEAARTWQAGAVLAAQLQDVRLLTQLLERQQKLCVEMGQTELARELGEQLATLRG